MNMMVLLQQAFGNKFQEMMYKWNNMTPQQKEDELNKVRGLTEEQRLQYLKSMGIDPSMFNQKTQQPSNPTKFNY